MADSAMVRDQAYHVRSASMPSRSHPLALRVDEELHKLRSCVASSSPLATSVPAQMMCDGLKGLGVLYDCIEDLLRLPSNQQALSRSYQRKWVEEELDGSIRLLDLCVVIRDNLVTMKEHVQDLQSALRRKDASIDRKSEACIRSRKKAQKDLKNCLRLLKRGSYPTFDEDSDILIVVKVLMEAREITISLLRSVLSFLSMQRLRPKTSRWAFVSKALYKREVASVEEHEHTTYVGSVDFSFYASHDCGVKVQKAQNQLKALEVSIEDLETGLECLFRRLIRYRVSLLNIHSF